MSKHWELAPRCCWLSLSCWLGQVVALPTDVSDVIYANFQRPEQEENQQAIKSQSSHSLNSCTCFPTAFLPDTWILMTSFLKPNPATFTMNVKKSENGWNGNKHTSAYIQTQSHMEVDKPVQAVALAAGGCTLGKAKYHQSQDNTNFLWALSTVCKAVRWIWTVDVAPIWASRRGWNTEQISSFIQRVNKISPNKLIKYISLWERRDAALEKTYSCIANWEHSEPEK